MLVNSRHFTLIGIVATAILRLYRHPYYEQLGFKAGHCPEAEKYYAEAISLPMFQSMLEEQQHRVVAALTEVLA